MKNRILLLSIALISSGCIIAQDWNQIMKTASSTRAADNKKAVKANARFGSAVAIDGVYAVVGIPADDGDAYNRNLKTGAGAVVILQNVSGNWQQMRKIVAVDRAVGDGFGVSVAISGTTIIVGSNGNKTDMNGANSLANAGAAYIFSKNVGGLDNWGQVKKIVANDRATNNTFGYSVAISGSNIVVGADLNETDANNANTITYAGAAYVFNISQGGFNNWGQVKKIVASDRANVQGFGNTVAISGNNIIVGTNGGNNTDASDLNPLNGAGCAYIFNLNFGGVSNWGQVKKLVANNRYAGDLFGITVSINSNNIVVGALNNKTSQTDNTPNLTYAGAAYIFNINEGGVGNWGQVKKIVANDRAINSHFGSSVSISGNLIAISTNGTSTSDANGLNILSNAGAIYTFSKDQGGTNNWGQVKKIVANDRTANAYFGVSVSISGTNVITGATGVPVFDGSTTVNNAGAIYVNSADQGGVSNWGQVTKLNISKNSPEYRYGYKVAIDGNYAVVGADLDPWDANSSNPIFNAGSAYVLKNDNGTWKEIKKLFASDIGTCQNFGSSVSISGNIIAVGASNNRTNEFGGSEILASGAVYIFNKDQGGMNTWGQTKKIVSSDRAFYDNFGFSIGLNNGVLAVSSPYHYKDVSGLNSLTYAGAIYIFGIDVGGINNWGQVKKIAAPDRAANDFLGGSLALNNNNLVVSSNNPKDANGLDSIVGSGSAYIFNKDQGGLDNWGFIKKIVASDRAIYNYFGTSVSIKGDYILIGATGNKTDVLGSNTLSNAGAAYIFKKDFGGSNNWGQLKKIVSNNRFANDVFGKSVSLNDNSAAIGSENGTDNTNANTLFKAGAVFIFNKNQGGIDNWGYLKKVLASDRTSSNYFGVSIAISNELLIVGANGSTTDASGSNFLLLSGAAYIYKDNCFSLPISSSNTQIATAQNTSTTVYANANCNLVATIAPSGANPIIGHTNTKLWIETIQPNTTNNQFVKRHYEITPASNASTASGRITLYFTQQDFDDFNATSALLKLPSNSLDAAGKAALLIEKLPGISSDSSGLPNSYIGTPFTIDPIDSDIIWNNTENRWEVSFETNGFSGFFIKTQSSILAIKWLHVSGNLTADIKANISFKVQENNVAHYDIEKSINGVNFNKIASLNSLGDGINAYNYIENVPLDGVGNYRIRQLDKTGKSQYSTIIKLTNNSKGSFSIYPNPTVDFIAINANGGSNQYTLYDLSGKVLQHINTAEPSCILDLTKYSSGLYVLKINNQLTHKIIKQ